MSLQDRLNRAQRRLAKLGWVLKQGESLFDLIQAYQEWHGLAVDGDPGPQTLESIEAPRFCGLPDRPAEALAQGQLCKWQDAHVTWTWIGQAQLGLAERDVLEAAAEAWETWARVCGIRPEHVESAAQADVVMGAGIGREAGPSGTLAWSEMPCSSSDHQLQQRYDTQERWVVDGEGSNPRGIDLVRVMRHEIGHALGLPHQPAGNLMAPTYSPTIHSPQPFEVAIVSSARMYGAPIESTPGSPAVPPSPPVTPPLPPGGDAGRPPEIEIKWNGRPGRVVWEAV